MRNLRDRPVGQKITFVIMLISGVVLLLAFAALFCFLLHRHLRKPTTARLVVAGFALGLALATKFSALLLPLLAWLPGEWVPIVAIAATLAPFAVPRQAIETGATEPGAGGIARARSTVPAATTARSVTQTATG